MRSYTGEAIILGGLPVIATVYWSYDEWTMEHDFTIEAICWRKRDGTAGKPVPQSVWDRAEKHDSYFCNLNEQLNEQAAYEAATARGEEYPEPQELISLDPSYNAT